MKNIMITRKNLDGEVALELLFPEIKAGSRLLPASNCFTSVLRDARREGGASRFDNLSTEGEVNLCIGDLCTKVMVKAVNVLTAPLPEIRDEFLARIKMIEDLRKGEA